MSAVVEPAGAAADDHDHAGLVVTRLLQNPLGTVAPPGSRGDIVKVSDGVRSLYLTPAEYEGATTAELRYRIARGAD